MPPAQDPDVTQSADEDDTSDPYIDVQINEDEDIDNALKSWDVLVNPIYKSGLDNAASDAVFSSAEPRIRDSGLQWACSVRDRINQFERLSQSAPSHELERVLSENHEDDQPTSDWQRVQLHQDLTAGGAVQNERGAGQGGGQDNDGRQEEDDGGNDKAIKKKKILSKEVKKAVNEEKAKKVHDAIAGWKTGQYQSVSACAEYFQVPRTTLRDMIRDEREEWTGLGGKQKQGLHTRGGENSQEFHRWESRAGCRTDIAS